LSIRIKKAFSSLVVLLLPLGSIACGGEAEAEPVAPQQDPDCEAPGIVDPTLLIDDMEDGDSLVAAVGIRNGAWWIASDGTGTVTPAADQPTPPERILGGRCESEYAMRISGEGFTDWGAVMSATFRFTNAVTPYDASPYRGITFWARVGEGNNSVIRAQVQDASTHLLGGICNPTSGAPDECYNAFGATLDPIDTEWRKFTLEFSALTQREGWGYRAEAVTPTALYDLEWNLDPNRTFDLWLDDIWFYE
jgi:hypothetical protein